jgi:hypothetical protein
LEANYFNIPSKGPYVCAPVTLPFFSLHYFSFIFPEFKAHIENRNRDNPLLVLGLDGCCLIGWLSEVSLAPWANQMRW